LQPMMVPPPAMPADAGALRKRESLESQTCSWMPLQRMFSIMAL
jgi:hypothetical protein